jgi:hypothetical protein
VAKIINIFGPGIGNGLIYFILYIYPDFIGENIMVAGAFLTPATGVNEYWDCVD